MITDDEKQEIINAVLSAIRTNSALITDLTEVTTVPDESYIELSGGRRISGTTLVSIIQEAIMDDAVNPTIAQEQKAREAADVALQAAITTIDGICKRLDEEKLDAGDVVSQTGTSTSLAISQAFFTEVVNAANQKIANIKLEKGDVGEDYMILKFTSGDGTTASIRLVGAIVGYAGLMTSAQVASLAGVVSDVATLKKEHTSGVVVTEGVNSATIAIKRADADALTCLIPSAGKDENDNYMAGVMSGEQAKNLEDVVGEVYPMVVECEDLGGDFEIGTEAAQEATCIVTMRGENISGGCHVTATSGLEASVTEDGISIVTNGITSDRTEKLTIDYGTYVWEKEFTFKFKRNVYVTIFDEESTEDPTVLIGTGSTYLSDDTTIGKTELAAGQGAIVAIPGMIQLICRDSCGAEISGTEMGYKDIEQPDGSTYKYTYIIVPASTRRWWFYINNN